MKRRGFFASLAGLAAVPLVKSSASTNIVIPTKIKLNSEIDPLVIRDRIVSEITKILEEGTRGYREHWIRLMRGDKA